MANERPDTDNVAAPSHTVEGGTVKKLRLDRENVLRIRSGVRGGGRQGEEHHKKKASHTHSDGG